MATNPFRYGSPVGEPYFAGRKDELEALASRMRNAVNVVVTAPRRYGKSSLLGRAGDIVAHEGGAIVRANLLRTPSPDALANRLVGETYRLRGGPWRRAAQAVPEFLRRIRLHPTVAFDEAGRPTFSFATDMSHADASQLIEDVYRLLDELAEERPTVLMLDEFQAVTDLGVDMPRLLKGLCDQHPRVSLVMAGSKQHLMEALVLSAGAPLYHMAERLALGPIDEGVMRRFLRSRAKAGGKAMTTEASHRILAMAGPVPYDIQRLAYEVYDLAGNEITVDEVERGVVAVTSFEAESHAERFAALSVGHRRVLVALAGDVVRHPQSAELARKVGYANPAGVAKALRALMEDETVVERDGVYVVADPFFRAWLRQVE